MGLNKEKCTAREKHFGNGLQKPKQSHRQYCLFPRICHQQLNLLKQQLVQLQCSPVHIGDHKDWADPPDAPNSISSFSRCYALSQLYSALLLTLSKGNPLDLLPQGPSSPLWLDTVFSVRQSQEPLC